MPELLLELLSEEIPARMQTRAADDLKRLVTEGLTAAGLDFTSAEAYATPRRLTLVVDGLPATQPDIREERRGPRADAPEKAVAGFRGSLPEGAKVEERKTEKGTFLYAVIEKKGGSIGAVVVDCLGKVVWSFPWPKSMRWADSPARYVRPLHNILAVFDGHSIEGSIHSEGSVEFSLNGCTCGHRFLAPEPITVSDFADYRSKLLAAKVMLDPVERRAKIEAGLAARAAAEGLAVRPDPGLLDEVTGLVEWPAVLMGSIDRQFMDVPQEVLITSMRSHQKYFALLAADGSLAPRFGLVANMETADGGAAIVAGNERVLRARLSDAKFFWDQDRRQPLASKAPALKGMVFHAKLGTLADKVERVEALAVAIAPHVPGADRDLVRSAAQLAKADLVSGMVGEFPELQGVMGRYYARHDGEREPVAAAIAEHYAPQGPNDRCPSAPVSVCVALADKIDTLVGFWAIDEKPTGSRDPYALRRAALGVIRIVLENELALSVRGVIDLAKIPYRNDGIVHDDASWTPVAEDLRAFIFDRLKIHLRDRGVRHDLISALFATGYEDDLLQIVRKAEALSGFLATDDGANLLVAYRRAANIVRIEEQKGGWSFRLSVDETKFDQPEEKQLQEAIDAVGVTDGVGRDVAAYRARLRKLSGLRGPVDRFFDRVTVNVDDRELRANRLSLLSEIQSCLNSIADFSQIEG